MTVPQLAEVLERAREHALPGREAYERDAILWELRELLQPPKPRPFPLRLVRRPKASDLAVGGH
jgi:hypothetical protein